MSDTAGRRDQVMTAALEVFGRYGYRRTSMDQIAKAAGMSRPALYQYFKGKDDVFRAMGERLIADLLAGAEAASRAQGTPADHLYGALAVKLDFVAGSVEAEFRSELLAEAAVIIPDLMRSLRERHAALIETLLTSAEFDQVEIVFPVHDIAVLLLDALTGIAQQKEPAEELRRRLRQLVDLTVRSLSREPQS